MVWCTHSCNRRTKKCPNFVVLDKQSKLFDEMGLKFSGIKKMILAHKSMMNIKLLESPIPAAPAPAAAPPSQKAHFAPNHFAPSVVP